MGLLGCLGEKGGPTEGRGLVGSLGWGGEQGPPAIDAWPTTRHDKRTGRVGCVVFTGPPLVPSHQPILSLFFLSPNIPCRTVVHLRSAPSPTLPLTPTSAADEAPRGSYKQK